MRFASAIQIDVVWPNGIQPVIGSKCTFAGDDIADFIAPLTVRRPETALFQTGFSDLVEADAAEKGRFFTEAVVKVINPFHLFAVDRPCAG